MTRTMKIDVFFHYTLEEWRISAAFNPDTDSSYLDREIGDMMEDDINDFIKDIKSMLKRHGFEVLDDQKSNRGYSKSFYIDFCRKDEYDQEIVRVVFHLRVSDHRLHNKRSDGSDRTKDAEAWGQSQRELYSILNKNGDLPEWCEFELIVSGHKFKTYRQAIAYVESSIRKRFDE